MAVTIKRVMLWQTEIRNEPGALSAVLEPLAQVGLDLHAVIRRVAADADAATSGEPAPQ